MRSKLQTINLSDTIPESSFDAGFTTQILDRSFYDNGLNFSGNTIQAFTGEFKSCYKVVCGIFAEQLILRLPLTLPDNCNTLQTEIMFIKFAAMRIRSSAYIL